jgi:hypothetical protein
MYPEKNYSEKKITFLDELPPLADLEHASRNQPNRMPLVENFNSQNNNRSSPYSSYASIYGGDSKKTEEGFRGPPPNRGGGPGGPREDDNRVKEQMMDKAVQKLGVLPDGNNLAMYMERRPPSSSMDSNIPHPQARLQPAKPPHQVHYRPHEYVIPDDSYVIYEEPSSLIPSYHVLPPQSLPLHPPRIQSQIKYVDDYDFDMKKRHKRDRKMKKHGDISMPMPMSMQPDQTIQPCQIIYNHMRSCPLCSRLYIPKKHVPHHQRHHRDGNEPSAHMQKCSVSSAIYVIIIIFLLTICTFMARKLLASDSYS